MSIRIEHLTYIYMKDTPFEKKALDDISLDIDEGEFIAVIGHTGSGKSTLIQHINGLLKGDMGKVYVDDVDLTDKGTKLSEIRKKVGLVFQYPEYQLFEETVAKDIAFGPLNLGYSQAEAEEKVRTAMEMVGLDYDKYKDKSPFDLSGGQKRRTAIAGVLAMGTKYLILDEPTAGLDPKGRDEILGNIKQFHEKYNKTVIFVSHNMEDVAKLATRIIVMNQGRCILDGTPEEIFTKVDVLEKVGLAVPQVTYLSRELKKRGFNIPDNIFTVEQAREALLRIIRSKQND